jgi:hypothetical protein
MKSIDPAVLSDDGVVEDVAESPGLPDAKPVKVMLDEAPDKGESREEIFSGSYHWKGQDLLPYTPTKKGTWDRLCAVDVPLPMNEELRNAEVYAPQAYKLLYLLTHRTEDYAHLRAKPEAFLAEIERWVDANCTHADTLSAVLLALKIHNDQLKMIAVPKPGERGGSSGN